MSMIGQLQYYSSVIGILRWAMELGWIDICTEVSMMALFMAAPRTGHDTIPTRNG